MLFNSYQFLFAFLPVTFLGFCLLGRISRGAAMNWLTVASLAFYALWRPFNVVLIAPSIIVNYFVARELLRLRNAGRHRAAFMLLACGVLFNVAFLSYFKYTNFLLGAANDLFGTHFPALQIALPLAISFITFQKIAFLVDVHGGRVDSVTVPEYCLFVLFFPQLIAGPIVHFREVMPQYRTAAWRFDAADTSVALTLFIFGLFKKVVLADGLATLVSPLYAQAASGSALSLVPAWLAAVGFTLQIYFDFSGYTDMAIGLGRLFGIRLPANFDSPFKARSIIDYWLHWNMTLTRFLTAYVYNPLVLAIARHRAARGKRGLDRRAPTLATYANMIVFPIMVTMLVSGLWHGAGYTFVLWGLIHGAYLCINHGWRLMCPQWLKSSTQLLRTRHASCVAITFVSVVAAMVLFRAPTVKAAGGILAGMLGAHGVAIPVQLIQNLGPLAKLFPGALGANAIAVVWVAGLVCVVMLCPNTLQLLAGHEPALGMYKSVRLGEKTGPIGALRWSPQLAWAVATSVLAGAAIAQLSGGSEFLYWQF
jgi:D-alanyl-lipoteichoic acid acyltransferase DltB (MBOAT superfamily)